MSLVHRWPLTVNGNDAVGGLNLTNNGDVTFDKSNGAYFYGDVGTDADGKWLSGICTLTNPFSMTIWLKFSSTTVKDEQYPFMFASAEYNDYSNDPTAVGLNMVHNEYDEYRDVWYDRNYYIGLLGGGGVSSSSGYFTSSNFPSDTFVLCALTYDGSTASIYHNSSLINSRSSSFTTPSSNLSIGRAGASASGGYSDGYYYDGYALDARIYNHCLSASDISALYNLGPILTGGSFPQAIGCF